MIEIWCTYGACDRKIKVKRSIAVKMSSDEFYSTFQWTLTPNWDREPERTAWHGDAYCPEHLVEADDWIAEHEDN
jgi:hypothetical protein